MAARDNVPKTSDAARESNALSDLQRQANQKMSTEVFDDLRARLNQTRTDTPRERSDAQKDVATPIHEGLQLENGKPKSYTDKSGDTYNIERDAQGRVARVVENMGGTQTDYTIERDASGKVTRVSESKTEVDAKTGKLVTVAKDVADSKKFDDVSIDKDGVLTFSRDGKVREARTLDGGHREFEYNAEGKVSKITDTVHTNSGRDIVQSYSRLGNSNLFRYESNFSKGGFATNVVTDDDGHFKVDKVNDLVKKDFSDALHGDLAGARKHFIDIARGKGMGSFVETWSKKFEERCHKQAHKGQVAPSDQKIAKAYDYLEKILQGHGNVSLGSRKLLVRGALREYADPDKYINQSDHPSCAFANGVERHIAGRSPDDHARVLYEAVTNKSVKSKGGHVAIHLNEDQIRPDQQNVAEEKGGFGWSYSNKVFQIAAIQVGYGDNYHGIGYNFPGGTEDQIDRATRFVDGEKGVPLYFGNNFGSFERIQMHLKKHGTIALFDYIPGHCMAITDAKTVNGRKYIRIDNSWGGMDEGWKQIG